MGENDENTGTTAQPKATPKRSSAKRSRSSRKRQTSTSRKRSTSEKVQVTEAKQRPLSETGGIVSSATLDSETLATRKRAHTPVPGLTEAELKERDKFDAERRKAEAA